MNDSTHAFRWSLAVGPDNFAALPTCSCGWTGPLCWNVRAASLVWARHAEVAPTSAPTAPEHSVIISTAAFNMHVARCTTCGWFSAPLPYQAAQQAAADHRRNDAPTPMPALDWYGTLWTGDNLDADIAEREAVERHQHFRFSGNTDAP